MRIRLAVPGDLNRDEKAAALDAALEAVVRAGMPMISRGWVPTAQQAISDGVVRWRPEPPGDEHFDLPNVVMGRGWGDCDDLAPWHAGSLRVTGVDPEARAVVVPSGPTRWHAIVQRSDGTFEDPSRAAGMGSVGGDDYAGPFWPQMFPGQLTVATSPLIRSGGLGTPWAGRVDVPDMNLPLAWSGLWAAPTQLDAVRGAIEGALVGACVGCVADDDAAILGAVHDLLSGHDPQLVAEALDHVGFLPGIAAALPIASGVLSAVPGLGNIFGGGAKPPPAPAPAPAPAGGGGGGGGMPWMPGSGGGGHGPIMMPPPGGGPIMMPAATPGGPIIIRF